MAVSAVVAITGMEAATVAAAMVTVAEVGTAMSVVGAVTGNKDLMKIGGVVGMVGGLSSLAYNTVGAGAGLAEVNALDETSRQAAEQYTTDADGMQRLKDVAQANAEDAGITPELSQNGINEGVRSASEQGELVNSVHSDNPFANATYSYEMTPVSPENPALQGTDIAPAGAQSPSGAQAASAAQAPSSPADGSAYDPSTATRRADYIPGGKYAPDTSLSGSIKDFWSGIGSADKAKLILGGAGLAGSMLSGAQKADAEARALAANHQGVPLGIITRAQRG